jgi:hypothetical protein
MSRISDVFKLLPKLLILSILFGCQTESNLPKSPNSEQVAISSKAIMVQPNRIISSNLPKSIETILENVAVSCNSQINTFGTSSPILCGNIFISVYPAMQVSANTTFVPVVSYLSNRYKWQLKSTTKLESGQDLRRILKLELQSQGLQTLMSRSSYLIAVGTASREGDIGKEAERAEKRSDEIYDVLIRTIPPKNVLKKFYRINLGKYNSQCVQTANTSFERPIIIITILIEQEGEILPSSSYIDADLTKDKIKKLIKDSISLDPPADLKLECYPLFNLSE